MLQTKSKGKKFRRYSNYTRTSENPISIKASKVIGEWFVLKLACAVTMEVYIKAL
jgi:hypothetical protein